MRAQLSRAINGRFPRLSWNLWGFQRSAHQLSAAQVRPAARNMASRVASPRHVTTYSRTSLLIVVPSADHSEIPWEAAHGNYSFELYETAGAYLGHDRVFTIRISPNENTSDYHDRILDLALETGITHLLSRIDIEANGGPDWSWDLFVRKLRERTKIIYLPLTYDSAYPYVSMHLDRITRLYERAVPIVLDRPIQGVIRPRRPAAGPLFLPLSDASMERIDSELHGVSPQLDITFIGNVSGYPYRSELLDQLDQAGIKVDVNPQGRSEGQLAGFINYAEALRKSRITLNFTRCNGVPVTQLKTRMLEGALFGAVVAADSPLYADRYFSPGDEFISYSNPQDLRRQVDPLLASSGALEEMQQRARRKADILRVRNFWEKTDSALRANHLPELRAS